jgi:hypothetical protein
MFGSKHATPDPRPGLATHGAETTWRLGWSARARPLGPPRRTRWWWWVGGGRRAAAAHRAAAHRTAPVVVIVVVVVVDYSEFCVWRRLCRPFASDARRGPLGYLANNLLSSFRSRHFLIVVWATRPCIKRGPRTAPAHYAARYNTPPKGSHVRSEARESGPSWFRMPGTSSVSSLSSPLP